MCLLYLETSGKNITASISQLSEQSHFTRFFTLLCSLERAQKQTTGTFHSRKPNSGQVEQTLTTSDSIRAWVLPHKAGREFSMDFTLGTVWVMCWEGITPGHPKTSRLRTVF